MSTRIKVIATYPGDLSREKDWMLFNIARYVVGGTGMGSGGYDFRFAVRDNDWTVSSQEDAELLKTLLLQAPIEGLEVSIKVKE